MSLAHLRKKSAAIAASGVPPLVEVLDDIHGTSFTQTPLLQDIADLVEVLKSCIAEDFVIAGGYARDTYQCQEYNDIDVYVLANRTRLMSFKSLTQQCEQMKKQLTATGKFFFIEGSNDEFFNTVFCDPKPKYRVQIMPYWYVDASAVLASFDTTLCQFVIPVRCNDEPKTLTVDGTIMTAGKMYATLAALRDVRAKNINWTSFLTLTLKDRRCHLISLYKRILRVDKFAKRGFTVTPATSSIFLKALEKEMLSIESFAKEDRAASFYLKTSMRDSGLFADAYVDDMQEPQKITAIKAELIEKWLQLTGDKVSLLTSSSSMLREDTKQFLSGNPLAEPVTFRAAKMVDSALALFRSKKGI